MVEGIMTSFNTLATPFKENFMDDIKLIEAIILGIVLFIVASHMLYRLAGGDYEKLVRWSIRICLFFLLVSLIASMYDVYRTTKSLDILFGLGRGDLRDLLVASNLVFLILQLLFKWMLAWRGPHNLSPLMEQKLTV
jgi:hypothetical protein